MQERIETTLGFCCRQSVKRIKDTIRYCEIAQSCVKNIFVCLTEGSAYIAGTLWNVGFKAGVEREVAFSQQLLLLQLKQNIFFWSISCYREQRIWGQALKLQYDSINPLWWVALFLTCTERKRVLFSFGFFLSKFFFPHWIFFPMGVLATCPK